MRIAVNGVELFFDVPRLQPWRREATSWSISPWSSLSMAARVFHHSQFVPWLTPIADMAQLILVDHRGNGRSSRPPVETRTLANMADDLEALRQALGLGRIVVFGMSFGGMLALTYAVTYPDSVAGLIPCATAASNEALERGSFPPARHRLARAARGAGAPPSHGTVESAEDLDRVFAALSHSSTNTTRQRTPPGGFKPIADIDMLNWFFAQERATYDVRARLAEITAPTLVLTGRHDRIAPPDASDEIVKGIPGAEQDDLRGKRPSAHAGRERQVPSNRSRLHWTGDGIGDGSAFHRPESLDAAIAIAREHGETGRFLAGGTDLIIQINRGRIAPGHLISLAGLGLDFDRRDRPRGRAGCDGDARCRGHPSRLPEAARRADRSLGSDRRRRPVHNIATVGGNIVNAFVPVADAPPSHILMA